MEKKITVKDIKNGINQYTYIDENIIKRKILEGEEDIKNNRVYSAIEVFKGLRERFGY